MNIDEEKTAGENDMISEKEEPKKIMVIGHKNPDTDSICSAIAYSDLMNKVRDKRLKSGYGECDAVYEPCRAGVISAETAFVLDRFKFPIPRLCLDVHAQVSDLDIREETGIKPDTSIRDAWDLMRIRDISTLPVTDEDGSLKGVITVKDIAMANMDTLDARAFAKANVPVANILRTIDGKLISGDPDAVISSSGKVSIGASNPEAIEEFFEKDDILIVGNRYEALLCAVELGASLVITCMASGVSKTIEKIARENGCILICTEKDTYAVSRLINQSIPVGNYMKKDVITFEPSAQIEDVKDVMGKVRYNYFPVTEHNKVLGLISKRNLLSLQKKKLVLVDHNEKSQCVDGFDDAEIMGIIDHHRIGDIETTGPIIFRNVPVGCTATIITDMYHENGLTPPAGIAGLLLCAILSDTLCFKSPTCTHRDKVTAAELAELAGVDYEKLAEEMFDAGEDLTGKTADSVFRNDCKLLRNNGLRIAIAQGTFNSPANLKKAEQMMKDYIGEVLENDKLDLAFYIATSIRDQSSDVIYAGNNAESVLKRAFETEGSEFGLKVKGLVSRKKQFVPSVISVLGGE